MERKVFAVVVVLCFVCVIDGIRIKRGYNTGGYGSERGGYYSNERDDASVSHDDGQPCSAEDSYESREISYGRTRYDPENSHYIGIPR